MRDNRLAKTKADLLQLLFFGVSKVWVTARQEIDSLSHPLDLLLLLCANYTTLANRAEQLVTGPIVRRLRRFCIGLSGLTSVPRQQSLLQSYAVQTKKSDLFAHAGAKNRRSFPVFMHFNITF